VTSVPGGDDGRPTIGPTPPPALHVMTFNLRRRLPALRADGPDRWSRRAPLVARLLTSESPAVLAVQEVMPDQSAELAAMLGDRYTAIGSGRDRRRGGERVEVHVDTERLRVLSSRIWWLSDRPDVPGSRGPGALFPRAVVQVALSDLATGARVQVLAVHVDPFSARAKLDSARRLRAVVAGLDDPVVVLGDFNAHDDSASHGELTRGGLLVDGRAVAGELVDPGWGSWSHYGPPRPGGRRLDWILVSPEASVSAAGVGGRRFEGAAASDHDPVHAVLRWPATRRAERPPEAR
jgi:endonuclease/exonuclease/phosphatase family metal-dependent hydrolase